MIGILGPTGQTGTPLLSALARAGTPPVKVLAHTPASAQRVSYDAADVAIGDVRDETAVAGFLDGVSTLFLLTSATPDQVEVQNRIVDAAVKADVGAIVKLSVCTASETSLDCFSHWHHLNDTYLEQTGLPYTILHPHTYMQTIALQFADRVRADGTMAGVTRPDRAIAMVDVRDVAEVAAAILLNGDHRGEKVLITGPEALSYSDCAKRIGVAVNRDVTYEQISPEQAYERFVTAGILDWLSGGLVALQQRYDTEDLHRVSDTVPRLTGKPARSFTDFLLDNSQLFT